MLETLATDTVGFYICTSIGGPHKMLASEIHKDEQCIDSSES